MNTEPETIFSKIIRKEIPAKVAFENDRILAFHDINPQAPLHIIIIPKRVIRDVGCAAQEDAALLGELLLVAKQLAAEEPLCKSGYRLVTNTGKSAGQTVFHLHFHLLAGREFHWPPG